MKERPIVRIECPPTEANSSGSRLTKALSTAIAWLVAIGMFVLVSLAFAWCISWLILNWPGV